jgi:hypothetical protein
MKRILVFTTLTLIVLGAASRAETITLTSAADTFIQDGTARGDLAYMYIYGGSSDIAGYVRFDLSGMGAIVIHSAQVIMTVTDGAPRADVMNNGRFSLYGLNEVAGNTPQSWDEATLTESGTNPVGAEWIKTSTNAVPFDLTTGRIINLDGGEADVTETINPSSGSYLAGTTATVTGPALVTFLQNRVYYGDGQVTFIIGNDDSNARGYGIATKENATEAYRPQLILDYTPITTAYLPVPADGAVVPAYWTELSWRNPDPNDPEQPDITCDVYLGTTEPNALYENYGLEKIYEGISTTSVTIPYPLSAPNTYYWVVDCHDPNAGLIPGKFWSFIASSAPEIQADPSDTSALEGDSASFSAGFTSTSDIVSNKWYKAGEPAVELLPSDPDVTIELFYDSTNDVYTSTLTLANIETADDGLYYCALGNAGGATPSASAKLIVKRLIAHWKFEGNAVDETGVYNGTLTGEPVFETDGLIGQAMIFDGTDDYVDLPDGFSDFSAGMSISVWSNPTTAANWARFIDFGNGAGGVNILFTRNGVSNTLRFDTNDGTVDAENAFTQNEWQYFVVTMTEAGAVTIYKNGLPVQTGTVGLPEVVTRTLNYIGESNWSSDAFYAGMMDDLRIYNYAITADQIADLYTGVVGSYCRNRPVYDFDGDCLVLLSDFVYWAGYWLDCGFYPNADCQ